MISLDTVAAVAISFAVSAGFTPVMRWLALRFHFVDRPNHRKIHRMPMPLLGGIALYMGSVAGLTAGSVDYIVSDGVALWGSGLLLLLVGTIDDLELVHSQFKLIVAIPMAAGILAANGFQASIFSGLLAEPLGHLIDFGLTVLWIVSMTSALSILDHMDGLCAGLAAIAFTFFLVIAAHSTDSGALSAAAALLGGTAGFLLWNAHPARIFMGDGGAMFLGLALSAVALRLKPSMGSSMADWCIPILVLGVPIFDISLVTYSRIRRGLIPSMWPGRDHTAHRLVSLGLTQRQAVARMYLCGLALGLVALVASKTGPVVTLVFACAALTLSVWIIQRLERVSYEQQERYAPKSGDRKEQPQTLAGATSIDKEIYLKGRTHATQIPLSKL